MEFKVGDVVRFKMETDKICGSPIYAQVDDIFKIVKIVEEQRFYSGVGVYIKSIPCPSCRHHNEVMIEEAQDNNGFDSGWFQKL